MKPNLPAADGVRFRLIAELDGYAVGDDGSVWSCINNKLTPGEWSRVAIYRRTYGGRYCVVSLRRDRGAGKVVARYVHRLVLLAFVGPCPKGQLCLHGDRDTANNRLTNIRWGTPVQNAADKVRHNTVLRGEAHPNAILTDEQVSEIQSLHGMGGWTEQALADKFHTTQGTINKIVRRLGRFAA